MCAQLFKVIPRRVILVAIHTSHRSHYIVEFAGKKGELSVKLFRTRIGGIKRKVKLRKGA